MGAPSAPTTPSRWTRMCSLARFIHGASTRPPGEFSERVWDEMRPNCTAELGRIERL